MKKIIGWTLGLAVGGLLYYGLVTSLYRRSKAEADVKAKLEMWSPPGRALSTSVQRFLRDTDMDVPADKDLLEMTPAELRTEYLTLYAQLKRELDVSPGQWSIHRKDGRYLAAFVAYPRIVAFEVDLKTGQVTPASDDVAELVEYLGGGDKPASPELAAVRQAALEYQKTRSDYVTSIVLDENSTGKDAVAAARDKFLKAASDFARASSQAALDGDAKAHHYDHLLAKASTKTG